MRRVSRASLMAVLLIGALAAPSAAVSPIVEVAHDRGGSAYGDKYSCEVDVPHKGDETCEWTSVWAFEGSSSFNGDRFKGERVCISQGTSVYDKSARTYTDSFAFGCAEDGDVSIARDLSTGSAVATVATESDTCVYDIDSDTSTCSGLVPGDDVSVDLTWTAISPVSKSSWRSRDQFGDCTNTSSFRGQWADASVTGTPSVAFDYGQIQLGASRYTTTCHG